MKKSASSFLGLALISSAASATSSLSGEPVAKAPKLTCRPEFRVTGRDTGRRVCAANAEWRHFDIAQARARRETAKKADFYLEPDRNAFTPSPTFRSVH
jgi:hypothetical protein